MGNAGRVIFLGGCGAALLALLHLGSSVREPSHTRTDRRGSEAPVVSGRDHAPSPSRASNGEGIQTERAGSNPATRARRPAGNTAGGTAARADRREQGKWERLVRRLERDERREAKRREHEERLKSMPKRKKPPPLLEWPDLGPPVEGVEGYEKEKR